MYRSARVVILAVVLLASGGCLVVSNRALFNEMNKSDDGVPPPRPAPAIRVSWVVRSAVTDSYYDPDTVVGYLNVLGNAEASGGSQPLSGLYRCLRKRPGTLDCYDTFFDVVFKALGESRGYVLQGSPDKSREAERDLLRLASNLGSAGEDLQVLADQRRCFNPEQDKCNASARDPLGADLEPGIKTGLADAAKAIKARRWHRDEMRKKTALVMSGGAADGAYIAGFVWSLLASYQELPSQPNLDLIVGTSTGSLIGAVVDSFFAKPDTNRKAARDLLLKSYTHSYQKDLLCIVPGWGALGMFNGSAKGLVRFNPVETVLKELVTVNSISNSTEFVTMTVDLTQGLLWAHSDQDVESMSVDTRVWTVMASIVEPALAEPKLPTQSSHIPDGMYIDGGVRSGLPLVEAARRGAERVIALSSSSIDPSPVTPRANGGKILFRSIDLFVDQLRDAEAQQAEGQAIARRAAERELCLNRYIRRCEKESDAVCGRRSPGSTTTGRYTATVGTAATWTRGRPLREVEDAWRSMWVFRGENAGTSSTNYGFDPRQMVPLFRSGVAEFKARCGETLSILGFQPADVIVQCDNERLGSLVASARELTKEPEGGWPTTPPQPDECGK